MSFTVHSASEQVARYLREELLRGRWTKTMPGEDRLVADLGVGRDTVKVALRLLEKEGVLTGRGPGRRRLITLPSDPGRSHKLKVVILPWKKDAAQLYYIVELQHRLIEAGHTVRFAAKDLHDLGMNLGRIERFVRQTDATAWVVMSGPRHVLEWFSTQQVPALALAGRRRGIPMASVGPDKRSGMLKVVRHLHQLGHRRIVLLSREGRVTPTPGHYEQSFLDELNALGIESGRYNLPVWPDSPEGFQQQLDRLFDVTPPTAMILDEVPFLFAAQGHLARRRILAPDDVSLICNDPHPLFEFCRPSIAHIAWNPEPVLRRIVRWADDVAAGKDDRKHRFTRARFVEGETVGPPRRAAR